MKELNLTVGQKCWSIQLGDCEVVEYYGNTEYPYLLRCTKGRQSLYHESFKHNKNDAYPSLFESNPFERSVDTNETIEPKLVRQQNDGWVDNKAELINALCNVIAKTPDNSFDDIVKEKLFKLLESL